ncbi:MAG: hypothetical protein HY272_11150 [Gammaproteobacteria bacterium]|nr:hypothetical protein [Gammaproteobacteria bacterium]
MSSMNSRQDKTRFWDERRGVIRNRRGGWIIGEAVYNHGYSMMDDLVGYNSYFQVLLLNITGRLPEKRLADWIEASFICLSWPDPRIWCNKMGAYAGTMQCSPVAAASMGILAADSRMYGAGALREGAEFIIQARKARQRGVSIRDIISSALAKKKRGGKDSAVIMGYARPIATGDERVPAMERVSKELGFEIGGHLELAYEIEAEIRNLQNESINMLGYSVAFLVDQGFSVDEITRIYSTWVSSGVHACYAEYRDQPPESFLPLCCNDIDYQGKAHRPVPV